MRGLEVALRQANRKAGGRDIEIITVATNASPDSAIRGIRKLVEQDRVPLVIGPVSGSEGIAIRDYSKTQPGVTVINGTSAAMETTYVTPSENFFRFNTQGAQWMVGVGDYIYNVKKYRKIAALAEDYSFPYTQLFGLTLEFCQLGGQITERLWVPLGTKDFASIIAKLPDDVDAIYLGLGGGDAVNFLNQYTQAGGKAKMIGGSIMVDQTVLSSKGAAKRALIGTPTGGPQADAWDNPKWQAWVKAYQDAFPADKRFTSPSLTGTNYYNATNAMFAALNTVNGDLSDGHKKLQGDPVGDGDRRAERQDQARRQTPGDRSELRHRGGRGAERRPHQQDGEGHSRGAPDARLRRCRLREARPAEPHQSGMQGQVLTPIPAF